MMRKMKTKKNKVKNNKKKIKSKNSKSTISKSMKLKINKYNKSYLKNKLNRKNNRPL